MKNHYKVGKKSCDIDLLCMKIFHSISIMCEWIDFHVKALRDN